MNALPLDVPAIRTEGLSRRFGEVLAVNDLNLTIAPGEVFGFLGPNGAGKTTTVRLLNGVLTPSAGHATVLGHDVASDALSLRRRTGVLTESPNLYEGLTARENLTFSGEVYGVPQAELPRRVAEVLEEFGLGERANDRVSTFSKGMKQRLAIARTLLHGPELLFFDEPTAGLDPEVARMVTDLIQRLSSTSGRTIFLCTHNLDEAERLCNRVGIIGKGVLKAIGRPEELAAQLWQTHWVEIGLRPAPQPALEPLLQSLPYVHAWQWGEERLDVELPSEDATPDLVAALASAGARLYRVAPRRHSLAEIYFRIQGEAAHAGGETA